MTSIVSVWIQRGMIGLALWAAASPAALHARNAQGAQPSPQQAPKSAGRVVGPITAIKGNSLTIKADGGADTTVVVGDSTRFMQTVPGQKDLTGATKIQLTDLEVGDRVLARTTPSEDGSPSIASMVIVMKQADVAQKRQQEQEDWQRSGEGGLVKAVDPAAQTVTISVMSTGGAKMVTIHATPTTITRRYAPDSIEFDAAQAAPLSAIKPGDQLRARGTRSADGTELQAAEIVSGTFRNVVATVTTIDATAGTLTARDLVAKTAVTIKITHDSQLRKIPPMMAQVIAMRLKGGNAGPAAAGGAPNHPAAPHPTAPGDASASGPDGGQQRQWHGQPDGAGSSGQPGGADHGSAGGDTPRRQGAPGDLQQALSRAPSIQLSDLQKGDAIMVVTTEGSPASPPTVVTLLAGVEPMLQASTSGSQSMLSASWNLSGGSEMAQ